MLFSTLSRVVKCRLSWTQADFMPYSCNSFQEMTFFFCSSPFYFCLASGKLIFLLKYHFCLELRISRVFVCGEAQTMEQLMLLLLCFFFLGGTTLVFDIFQDTEIFME